MLRVLAGLETPDAGTIERAPRQLTVGYLPQEPDAAGGESLLDYLARRTGVAAASDELDRRTAELSEDPASHDAYADALDRFMALGGDDLEVRAAAVCATVGLASAPGARPGDVAGRFAQPVATLSGGEAARAALAAILLSRVDVLLLDEPTNNLDFAGLDLLEGFVDTFGGAVLVVSHDRAFLDRTRAPHRRARRPHPPGPHLRRRPGRPTPRPATWPAPSSTGPTSARWPNAAACSSASAPRSSGPSAGSSGPRPRASPTRACGPPTASAARSRPAR